MKYFFLILLMLILPLYSQQVMTAEDAIRRGLKHNYDIRIARNNAEISANNTGQGTAAFLPTLDASGSFELATSDQETNNPFIPGGKSDSETRNARISLNWTLFDGFRMFASKGQFDELAELGEYQARNVIENTVVQILAAYFDLVRQEQLLEVAENALRVSETRLEKEEVRHEVGGASSTDLLNARVSYNNDRAALLDRELAVLVAQKDLNILLGQEPNTPVNVVKEIVIPPLEMSLEEITELAAQRNSSVLIAEQNKRISEQNIKLARSSMYPRLSLGASYGITDRTSTTTTDNPNFPPELTSQTTDGSIGLTLSFNLFNGFRDKIDLENARIEARNQRLVLKDARNQLAGLIREKYDTFQKHLELVALEQENVIAARQNLQLQQDRFEIGATTSLEFRDAQVNLIRAQTELIVARYQARITRLEIEQLTGRLVLSSQL